MDNFISTYKLPKNFNYLLIQHENESSILSFRIKEVTDETAARAWIKKLMDESLVTWRISKTYPKAGKINVFRLSLRCQHLTDKRTVGVRTSKNTNCPAVLDIAVKRFIKNSKAKVVDLLTKDYPTIVTFKKEHNHEINSAAVLKFRDMSDETKSKFCALFQLGHRPSSALYFHKTDLLLECRDDYLQKVCDGKYVPSLSKVDKLFKKNLCHEYKNISDDEDFNSLHESLEENSECSVFNEKKTLKLTNELSKQTETSPSKANIIIAEINGMSVTEKDQEEFQLLTNRIKDGLLSNPAVFVPAFKKMLTNAKTFASTEKGLVSAMHTFANYSGLQSLKQTMAKSRCHKMKIGVQPTKLRKRKLFSTGMKRLITIRQIKQRNILKKLTNNTSFGRLPSWRNKTIDLQECTYTSKTLG